MELPLNVDVHCADGRAGRSTHVILNPTTEQVSHLVVRERRPSATERLVPVDLVANTTPALILLQCTLAQLQEMPLFNQTEFIYADVPHYATDPRLTLLWPYVVPARRMVDTSTRRMPPGELAVHRGTRVHATDGRVGRVDEFLIEPESGQVTHLILRQGHLWGRQEIAVPITLIERIEGERLYLSVDRQAVADLPMIPIRRSWE